MDSEIFEKITANEAILPLRCAIYDNNGVWCALSDCRRIIRWSLYR